MPVSVRATSESSDEAADVLRRKTRVPRAAVVAQACGVDPLAVEGQRVTTEFTKIRWVIDCADCHVSMPGESWPSHYRTKAHREALQAKGDCQNLFHSDEWLRQIEQGAAYNGAMLGIDVDDLARALVDTDHGFLDSVDDNREAKTWARELAARYAELQSGNYAVPAEDVG